MEMPLIQREVEVTTNERIGKLSFSNIFDTAAWSRGVGSICQDGAQHFLKIDEKIGAGRGL